MLKKIIAGVLVFGMSSLFAMSLSALNSASKAELMEINGIGEVKAAAIIKERGHGKFKSFEDLQRVDGIGEQTADNIRRGVKNSDDVKKVAQKTKTKAKKKTKTSKEDVEEKASKKAKKTKSKAKDGKTKLKSQLYHMDGEYSIVYMQSYGKFIIMDNETFNSTYVQMFILEKYDKNLFELVVSSPYSKIYKLKK